VFVRGPFVKTPQVSLKALASGLERIFRQPFYSRAAAAVAKPAVVLALPPSKPEDFFE
jgi:hypothetical protein